MKKILLILFFGFAALLPPFSVQAGDYNMYNFPITPPIPCNQVGSNPNPRVNCPNEMLPIYQRLGKPCATSYVDFLTDPINKHYWVEDPEITAQGKADERARQFLYWVISTEVIEDAPVLRTIWNISSLIALFGVVLIAAIFGIGYIISQRTQYNFNIRIWPTVIKIGMMLLYIAFSSAIVFVLIQFSEILMKFFYENLGGNELFNIYFANPSQPELIGQSEQSYIGFQGCRDLNIRVKDGIDAEVTMLKLTNVTYYVLGTMLLLRKILLWFLLFVSPFLALLMPFIFIRNTGWIWIGVFFQWLFYGPLVTLFLGALAKIWDEGIPWNFDFSRTSVHTKFLPEGYVYPTGINIVYGGPAQRITSALSRPIDASNNGSYIDTYAEYIITLIMLWAVTFFPWWLLRIFRDYCCEGIFAMKNILLAMYNQMQQTNTPPTGPTTPKGPSTLPSLNLDLKTTIGSGIKAPIAAISNFATIRTGDIAKNLNLQATRISDVARAETNKQTRQQLTQNIAYLSNPVKATTPAERQQYMKLRAELFNRAIKNDTVARTMLASTSSSQVERTRVSKEIFATMPQIVRVSVEQIASSDTKQSQQTVKNVANAYTTSIVNNNSAIQSIANSTRTSQEVVKNILQSYSQQTNKPITTIIKNIAQETKISESTIKNVLAQSGAIGAQAGIVAKTSLTQKLTTQQTTKILDSIRNTISSTKTTVEKIAGDTNVSESAVKSFTSNIYNAVTANTENVQQISNQTGATQDQVKTIINSYSSKISTINEAPQTIVNQIAKENNVSQSTVSNVLNATHSTIASSNIVNETATQQNISTEQAKTIVNTLSNTQSTQTSMFKSAIQNVVENTNIEQSKAQSAISSIYNTVTQNDEHIQQISNQTGSTQEEVKNILNTYSAKISTVNESPQTVINQTAKELNTSRSTVQNVVNASNSIIQSSSVVEKVASEQDISIPQAQSVVTTITTPQQTQTQIYNSAIEKITHETNIKQDTLATYVSDIYNSMVTNQENIQKISNQSSTSLEKVQSILTSYATNMSTVMESPQTIVNQIAKETNTSLATVENVINTANTMIKNSDTYKNKATEQNISNQQAQTIIETIAAPNITTLQQYSTSTENVNTSDASPSISQSTVQNIINSVASNETLVEQLSEKTQVSTTDVKNVLQNYTQNLSESSHSIIQTIASQTGIENTKIQNVLENMSTVVQNDQKEIETVSELVNISQPSIQRVFNAISQTTQNNSDSPIIEQISSASTPSEGPVVNIMAESANTTVATSREAVKNIMNSFVQNETLITNLAQQTGLKNQQISNIITTYANNIDQPATTIIEKISQSAGVQKENVRTTLEKITDTIVTSSSVVQDIAQKEGMKEEEVANVIQSQMLIATAPEQHIEKTIQIPQSVSLEDYEEVKKMWMNHYEEGDIPLSENIQNRYDWIEHDIVFITNTLNKLLSTDEKLRQEGLDELGYLLPIFLINNLKGEELLVYLKAKLEAAKATLALLQHENKIREKIEKEKDQDEEVFVDLKQEEKEDKHMALDEDEEELAKAPQSIEDRVKAVQEKLSTLENDESAGDLREKALDSIKDKLQDGAEKKEIN